jgi:hypothetical protein
MQTLSWSQIPVMELKRFITIITVCPCLIHCNILSSLSRTVLPRDVFQPKYYIKTSVTRLFLLSPPPSDRLLKAHLPRKQIVLLKWFLIRDIECKKAHLQNLYSNSSSMGSRRSVLRNIADHQCVLSSWFRMWATWPSHFSFLELFT